MALVFATCSDGGSTDASSQLSVAEAWELHAEVYCYHLFHCNLAEQRWRATLFEEEATCRQLMTDYYQSDRAFEVRDLKRLEASKALSVDADMLAMCLELGRQCSPAFEECRDMFEGRVQSGQPCYRSEQCIGDAYCHREARACPGRCSERKPAGSQCTASDQCSPGNGVSSCRSPAGGGVCARNEHLRAGAQEACGALSGADDEVTGCEDGLFCDMSAAGSSIGVCRAPIEAGATCDDELDACVLGAVCSGQDDVKRCNAVELRAEGTPCGSPEDASFCDVSRGLSCDLASRLCVALGDGSAGTRCSSGDLIAVFSCDPGLYCELETHTCVPQSPLGGPCGFGGQCSEGSCDIAMGGVCRENSCDDFTLW
jgi:hypothetical protein